MIKSILFLDRVSFSLSLSLLTHLLTSHLASHYTEHHKDTEASVLLAVDNKANRRAKCEYDNTSIMPYSNNNNKKPEKEMIMNILC